MSLSKAYSTSGKIFEQVSKKANPALFEGLKAIEPGEIVVVRGTYDHIELLLDTLKVPYSLIDAESIPKHNGGRLLLVNCKSYGDVPGKEAVKDLVREGGRLVTTDYALSFVTNVFPKRLEYLGSTNNDVVEIQCPNDIARRLVGLNYAQCHPKWWLEGASHVFDIKEGVTPIITSREMGEKYGKPYVAVGFKEGKGEVIHFISHLELQRTHLKTKEDEKGLDEFLKNMKATKTSDMDDLKVAELESAYSTLNTLAYLCLRTPILETSFNSIMTTSPSVKSGSKSKKLV
ncbi:hypothetical protein HZA97_04100 [Candidatus Woesearchaeota archaeon]|nr:hypothetical protein [Candidatus Woesearchaeota archaeon]